jgi:flap endonuclease-1
MSLYQFIVAVRQGDSQTNLTNDAGEVTSHIQGFVSRTVKLMELGVPHSHFHPRLSLSPHLSPSASLSPSPPQVKMMELGIKPVYVFDGKPPALKSGELATREEKKQQAELELKAALESGDAEEIRKASHRSVRVSPRPPPRPPRPAAPPARAPPRGSLPLSPSQVRVTHQMNADVQELLRLLGCPVVLAPCEAEASCAALCQAGKVYATATEDMDALTFGTPVMLKNLFDTESSRTQTKRPVFELHHAPLLEQLDVRSK